MLGLFFVMEHLYFAVKYIISYVVADEPVDVTEEKKVCAYCAFELIIFFFKFVFICD